MSRPRNCEISAALERAVDAPAGMFVTIGAESISWIVTEEIDAADVAALDLALTMALDAGYTGLTRDGVAGRIQGVPIRVAYAAAESVTGGRHRAVVSS
jgi:hypothetical protein